MAATSATTWFWTDWLGDPAVRRLTPAERGVWIDLLALMAAANPIGYLCDNRGTPLTDSEIARVTNAGTAEEVGKLIAAILEKDVASRDRTGRLYNRRMVRDAELKRKRSDAGRLGGKSTALKYFNENDTEKILPQRLVQQHRTRPSPSKSNSRLSLGAAREAQAVNSGETQQVAADEEITALRAKPPDQLTLAEINVIRFGRKTA